VKRRRYFLPLTLVGVALLLIGCAATGPLGPGFIPNGPQTFLAGADVAQARSLAMGSAVSKGWKIVDASGNGLLVRRALDTSAAESAVGGPVRNASVEVRTYFSQRQGGVDVVVGAAVIAATGSKPAETFDFTDSYEHELERSLESLRLSWEKNRWRIASVTPPLPRKETASEQQGTQAVTPAVQAWQSEVAHTEAPTRENAATSWPETDVAGTEAPKGENTATTWRETEVARAEPPMGENTATLWSETEVAGTDARTGENTAAAWSAPRAPVAEPLVISNVGNDAPAIEHVSSETTPAPVPAAPPPRAATPNDHMLALNQTANQGVWAYYAEHYAKIRGCDISGRGATLENKQPEFEIHRVHCESGQSFRVRCNAGTCMGIQ
jgi:hypothetical protein